MEVILGNLRGIAVSISDHHNKVNIAIEPATQIF